MAYLPPFGGFGGGASRSREAAGEGRRNHQRGTGQISAKTGESVVTRPRRRTRRLQCNVSGATLTEIEGPGTSSGAYGRGGGAGWGRAGGRDRAWDERKGGQSSCEGPWGRTGRGDVTHPPAARHCNDFFIAWDPFFSLLLLQPFFPRREPAISNWLLRRPRLLPQLLRWPQLLPQPWVLILSRLRILPWLLPQLLSWSRLLPQLLTRPGSCPGFYSGS